MNRKLLTALTLALLLPLCAWADITRAETREEDGISFNAGEQFQALAAKAMDHVRAGRIDIALVKARQAVQLSSRGRPLPATRAIADAWNQVGMVFFRAGFNSEAKAAYELGLFLGKKILPPTDPLFGNFHNNLGQVEQRLGNLASARDHLERAVSMQKAQLPPTLGLAVAMDNLGLVLSQLGDPDKAEEMHKEALSIFLDKKGPLDGDVATVWGNLANVHIRRRDFALAEKYLRQAYNTHQTVFGPEDPETLTSAAKLANLYLKLSKDAGFDELVNDLVTIGGETPSDSHMRLATLCKKLGSDAFHAAQLGQAERLAARAVKLYTAAAGPVAPDTLDAKLLLARIFGDKRSFAKAEEI